MIPEQDPVIAQALRSIEVPAHRDGFWEDLDDALADQGRGRRSGWSRGRRRLLAVAAAAAVVLVVLAALARPQGRSVDVGDHDGPPTSAPSAGLPRDGSVPPQLVPLITGAVTDFLDAAARNDTAGMRARLGPRSLAYGQANGFPDGLLGVQRDMWAGWARQPGWTATVLGAAARGPVDTALVVIGGLAPAESSVAPSDERVVPVARSAGGAWLVEPWAFEGAGANLGLQLEGAAGDVRPVVTAASGPPRWNMASSPRLPGVVQVLVDGETRLVRETTGMLTGVDLGAFPPGDHQVVILFFSDDGLAINATVTDVRAIS